MKIVVKSLQGDEYFVDLQNDQTVLDLKKRLSEVAKELPTEKQKLVYKGRTMQDASLLADYNLEDGCKVHLIVQRLDSSHQGASSSSYSANQTSSSASTSNSQCPMDTSSIRLQHDANVNATVQNDPNRPRSRFEIILRERLAKHFPPDSVEKIMANLQHEINADINSSSLDDLERLAKQKLNISNE